MDGVLSQVTKNKTYTPKNTFSDVSKDRFHKKVSTLVLCYMNKEGGGFEYNENNFKKNNYGTTQIKISKSIKRTNLGLSQHPPSKYYN